MRGVAWKSGPSAPWKSGASAPRQRPHSIAALAAVDRFSDANDQRRPPGLKPASVLPGFRGAEAPLFHGCPNARLFQRTVAPAHGCPNVRLPARVRACIVEVFRNLLVSLRLLRLLNS